MTRLGTGAIGIAARAMLKFRLLVWISLILALPAKPQAGTNEWGAWTGFSFSNPALIGTTTGRQLVMAGLRYGFVFGTAHGVAFEYTIDLVPAAIVIQPSGTQLASETGNPQLAGKGRPVVYGGGHFTDRLQVQLRPRAQMAALLFLYRRFRLFARSHTHPGSGSDALKFSLSISVAGPRSLPTEGRSALATSWITSPTPAAARSIRVWTRM